jgi:hypothetical protein
MRKYRTSSLHGAPGAHRTRTPRAIAPLVLLPALLTWAILGYANPEALAATQETAVESLLASGACGPFYCASSTWNFRRHAGDASEAGAGWNWTVRHSHDGEGGYKNWHDFNFEGWMEDHHTCHANCQGPSNGGNGGGNGGEDPVNGGGLGDC